MKTRIVLFASILALSIFSMSFAMAATDIEDGNEESKSDSCSAVELSQLRNEVMRIAGENAPKQAWRLVKEMLCGKSKASMRYVRANADYGVFFEHNDTYHFIPGKSLKPVNDETWQPWVQSIQGVIGINFSYSRYCIGWFNIHFQTSSWKVSREGINCD